MTPLRKILIAAIMSLMASPVMAASTPIQQSGTITPGQVPWWITAGVVGGSVSAIDSPVTSFGVTNDGAAGICVSSGRQAAAGRNQLCLGSLSNSASVISLQNYGTATKQSLNFVVNGKTITLPTGGGTVIEGNAPFVATHVPCFVDTSGTVQDCGMALSGGTVTSGVWNGTPVAVTSGGTGSTTPLGARTNLGLGTLSTQNSNAVAISGGTITGMPIPVGSADVAIKSYVDAVASGLIFVPSSNLATTAALAANTYNNGLGTLTANANGALTVDGTAVSGGNVILVKNEVTASHNGIYTVTATGDGSNPYVLTRATYFNSSANMLVGSFTVITSGSANTGSSWVLAATVVTVGTTAVTFNQFNTSGVTSVGGQSGPIGLASTLFMSGSTLGVTNGYTGVLNAQNFANVSGSASNTTGSITGTFTALTLASALDFKNGQGIRINHAGTATGLGVPSSLTVTPTGAAGSTTYTYTVAPFTATGGYGPAIANVSTTTGNATLSSTNYNALSWSAASGAVGYAVYGHTSGSMVLIAFVPGTTFFDVGTTFWANEGAPDWMPGTPPGSGAANWLVTSVSSGGGTTSLVLAASATTTATTQGVFHDDTVALQAAFTSANASSFAMNLGNGVYRITSQITSSAIHIFGNGPTASGAPGTIVLTSPTQNGLSLSGVFIVLDDFACIGGSISTSGQVAGACVVFSNSSGIYVERVSSQFVFDYIDSTTGAIGPYNINNNNINGYRYMLNITNIGDSSVYANQFAPVSIPGSTDAGGVLLSGDCGGAKFTSNKANAGGYGYSFGISCIQSSISDGDFNANGNSIEQTYNAGIQIAHSGGATLANINLVNNQLTGSGRGIYMPDVASSQSKSMTIGHNIIFLTTLSGIDIESADNFNISDNVLTGTGVGVRVGTNATGCTIGLNTYSGVSIAIQDASGKCYSPGLSLNNFLPVDAVLNNTGLYGSGPVVAQGTSGTWMAMGTVTLVDTGGAANFFCKLWDGTTVVSSAMATTPVANGAAALALSGQITSPAGNLRIDCRDSTAVTGVMKANATGNGKDSSITVTRLN